MCVCTYMFMYVGGLFVKKGQLVYRSKRPIAFLGGLSAGSFMGVFSDDNWNFMSLTLKIPPKLWAFWRCFVTKPDFLEVSAVPPVPYSETVRIFIYKSLALVGKVISSAVYGMQRYKGLTWQWGGEKRKFCAYLAYCCSCGPASNYGNILLEVLCNCKRQKIKTKQLLLKSKTKLNVQGKIFWSLYFEHCTLNTTLKTASLRHFCVVTCCP